MSGRSVEEIFRNLIQVESPPRGESRLARLLARELNALGFKIKQDAVGELIGGSTGNILAETPPLSRRNMLLVAHLDRDAPASRKKLQEQNGYLVGAGSSPAGGDDIAGISIILKCLYSREGRIPPGLGIVFTVAEELGLLGSALMPKNIIQKYDCALILDGEGSAGTIYRSEPAAGFFALTLEGRGGSFSARQKMLLRRLRHFWEKCDLSLIATLVDGPLPAWNLNHDEILIIGMKGESRNEIIRIFQKRLREIRRHFGIRGDFVINKVLHLCSGFSRSSSERWLRELAGAFGSAGLSVSWQDCSHISDACKFNDLGVSAVNLGLGLKNSHTESERVKSDSLTLLASVLESYFASY